MKMIKHGCYPHILCYKIIFLCTNASEVYTNITRDFRFFFSYREKKKFKIILLQCLKYKKVKIFFKCYKWATNLGSLNP